VLLLRSLSASRERRGNPDAYFVLTGANGRIFVHPDTTKLFRKTIFTDVDPQQNADIISLGHEMTEGRQGTMHVTVNDVSCHVCYQPVPGTGWCLALVCPEDKGPGLPENADELIYKPFAKIDVLSEDLGLGLPLSKRHALSLGGDLVYDKSYHDGCRFILEIPK
jgi:hypothetical protein